MPNRCRDVGAVYLDTDANILKAIWNPVHRYDANLIILTSDNTVRSYDLVKSYEAPEQEVCLTLASLEVTPGVHFASAETDEFQAVSIALGTSSDPHGRFTLYVLSREGDIYAICPFTPSTFVLTQKELEVVFDSAVAAEFEYRHSEDSEMLVRRHYKRQLDWTSNLWSQASVTLVESRQNFHEETFNEYYVLQRPESFPSPQLQGPFKISPYPEEYYYKDAADIATIDNGSCTVLCTTYSDGSVLIALQLHSIDMNWAVSDVSLDFSLEVVESISLEDVLKKNNLKTPARFSPSISVPSYSKNTFYIINDTFAHRIDISPWSKLLNVAFQDGDPSSFAKVVDPSNSSKIICLVDQRQDNSRICGVIDFDFERKRTLTITEDHAWLDTWDIPVPKLRALLPPPKEPESIKTPTHLDSKLDLEKLLQCLSLDIPRPRNGVSLKDLINFDVRTLTYSHEVGNYFSVELAKLHQIGFGIHSRLIDQRCELHRQILSVKKLHSQTKALQKLDLSTKVPNLIRKQTNLEARAASLLRRLSTTGSISLPHSDQEKNWFSELERTKKSLSGARGLESRVNTVCFHYLVTSYRFLIRSKMLFLRLFYKLIFC